MDIKVIGSGSSGNCYRVGDGKTSLLLEAGLPIRKIKAGCDFDLPEACLITHEHGDHAKSAKELMQCGVNVYTTAGTAAALGLDGYRLHKLSGDDYGDDARYDFFAVGTFSIRPFHVEHDAAQPVGYLIHSRETRENLLFATDTYYIRYKFPGLTHVMIEANYSEDALADAGNDPRRHRLRRSHMSIENCIEMLKANDLSHVQEIWLIHLSSSNGDAEGFKRRVQEATGCPVKIA
jgi:phosphoribosyl 1,2-cyclic phosphodiesterase